MKIEKTSTPPPGAGLVVGSSGELPLVILPAEALDDLELESNQVVWAFGRHMPTDPRRGPPSLDRAASTVLSVKLRPFAGFLRLE